LTGRPVLASWSSGHDTVSVRGTFLGWEEDGTIALRWLGGGRILVDPSKPGFALEAAEFPELDPEPIADANDSQEDPDPEADAHPDDVALMVQRLLETAERHPATFKVIEAKAKEADVPNLKKPGVKAGHLMLVDNIITEELVALQNRMKEWESIIEQAEEPGRLAIMFAMGAVNDKYDEPTEDMILRAKLLTEGLESGKLELIKGDDESMSLGVSEATVAELRKVHPEMPKLLRVVNPILQRYGFNSISRVGELRHIPLAAMLVLHNSQTNDES